jgi:hypothetical protein
MIRPRLDALLVLLGLAITIPAVWWHLARRAEWPRSRRRRTPHNSTSVNHHA